MNRKSPSLHLFFVAAFVLALALVPVALAGKGGGSGGSGPSRGGGGGGGGGGSSASLSLKMVTDNNGDSSPNYGDTITFNVSTSAPYPSVQLLCYKPDGSLALDQIAGFFPSYMWSRNYTLKSSSWTSGPAQCTATLYYTAKNGSNTTLAMLSVPVAA